MGNVSVFRGVGDRSQRWFWRLEDKKGGCLAVGGEPFATKYTAKRSIDRLQDLLTFGGFEVKATMAKNGKYYWCVYSRNAKLMAKGTKMIKSKKMSLNNFKTFKKRFLEAEICE